MTDIKRLVTPDGHEVIVDPSIGSPYSVGPFTNILTALVDWLKPAIAVETGVWMAQGTVAIAWALPPGGILYTLDVKILPEARVMVDAWGLSDRVVFVEGDSKQTLPTLPDGIGFAFVDGNHEPDGVQADFDALWPKMATNGIIAFHDVSGNCGVRNWLPQRFPESALPGVVYLPYNMGLALIQKGPRTIIKADGGTMPWPT